MSRFGLGFAAGAGLALAAAFPVAAKPLSAPVPVIDSHSDCETDAHCRVFLRIRDLAGGTLGKLPVIATLDGVRLGQHEIDRRNPVWELERMAGFSSSVELTGPAGQSSAWPLQLLVEAPGELPRAAAPARWSSRHPLREAILLGSADGQIWQVLPESGDVEGALVCVTDGEGAALGCSAAEHPFSLPRRIMGIGRVWLLQGHQTWSWAFTPGQMPAGRR